jgi:hypothetical protein
VNQNLLEKSGGDNDAKNLKNQRGGKIIYGLGLNYILFNFSVRNIYIMCKNNSKAA